jgi:hypothetical protein
MEEGVGHTPACVAPPASKYTDAEVVRLQTKIIDLQDKLLMGQTPGVLKPQEKKSVILGGDKPQLNPEPQGEPVKGEGGGPDACAKLRAPMGDAKAEEGGNNPGGRECIMEDHAIVHLISQLVELRRPSSASSST